MALFAGIVRKIRGQVASQQAARQAPVRANAGGGGTGRSIGSVPTSYSNAGPVAPGQVLSNDPRFPVKM